MNLMNHMNPKSPMKRIHQTALYALAAALTLVLSACNDFLDVKPKSEKLENELFENAAGFEDAISGVYASLQGQRLYGRDLLFAVPDVLSQDLECYSTSMQALARYDYSGVDALRQQLDAIWTQAYQVNGYANNILNNLEDHRGLPLYNDYRGEMLAVRALLHFDLLRLFAPTDETATGIPYVTTYSKDISPFLTVADDYQHILADLTEAEKLLADDATTVTYPRNDDHSTAFLNYRQTHFNLYAVQALLARVYWYRGDMANAAAYAEKVIQSGKFPLADPTEVEDFLAGTLSPKETLFGVYSSSYLETARDYLYNYLMYQSFNPYFDATGSKHLLPYDALYDLDVEAGTQDYRRSWFTESGAIAKCLKLVDHYALEDQVPASRSQLISGVTLLRSGELYLIAADALLDTNPAQARTYYNALTAHRGLPALRSDETLTHDRIFNEYHKEMYGEGQVWFNMKRRNMDIQSNAESRTIPASNAIYVIPIPADENAYRTE